MAAKLDIQQVLEMMDKHDLRYFAVMDGSKQIFLQDSNISLEDAKESLADFIGKLDGDTTTVRAYNIPRKKKAAGGNWTEFEWSVKLPGYVERGSRSVAGFAANDSWQDKYWQLKLDTMQKEFEARLANQQKQGGMIGEISDFLQKHNINPMDIVGMFTGLMGNRMPQATALAGPQTHEMSETVEHTDDAKKEYRQRLNAAIQTLVRVDDQFLPFIEQVASIADTTPNMYFMARKQIMGE